MTKQKQSKKKPATARTTIPIRGMDCASCAVTIERDLKKLKGVKSASVNYALARAVVEYDEKKIDQLSILDAIRKTGYEPSHQEASKHHGSHIQHEDYIHPLELILVFALAIPLLASMFWTFDIGSVNGYPLYDGILLVMGWILVLVFGRKFHIGTLKELKNKRANMDTLVTVGTGSALTWSTYAFFRGGDVYFEVAGMIIAFVLLGKFLEHRQRARAGKAIETLLSLHAKVAHRVNQDGSVEDVDPGTLRPGITCLVKLGEQIPTDGMIIKGSSTIDESMLTGEPIPVTRGQGDVVYGGTINTSGSFQMKVTAGQGNTMLDSIIRIVEHALEKKSPIEQLVDKVSGIFVPLVLMIAVVTFLVWLVGTSDIGLSIRWAVAVLIVACPCAMGLATPAAIVVGTGAGAKKGILIKDGKALEIAHRINTIVFDKTGTLTEGKPTVTDVIENRASSIPRLAIMDVAGALEASSEHPFAQAILAYIKKNAPKKLAFDAVVDFQNVTGRGVKGILKGSRVALGTETFITDQGVKIPKEIESKTNELRREAKTVIFVSREKTLIGVIAAQDRIKKESKKAIESLQKMKLNVALLTGDHLASANAVAKKLGIKEVYADVSPKKKAEIVSSLQKENKKVAFVGDGLNDAPALAQADLGLAIGTGTDVAIATGQIVIMKGSPEKVGDAIKLSRTTFRAIKQNLFWAFIYNIVGIPLAAFGYLNPVIASAAMAMSSVSVLTNSLRIKRKL